MEDSKYSLRGAMGEDDKQQGSSQRVRVSLLRPKSSVRQGINERDAQQLMRMVEALQKIVDRQTSLEDLLIELKESVDLLTGAVKVLDAKVDGLSESVVDEDMMSEQFEGEGADVSAALDGIFENLDEKRDSGGRFSGEPAKKRPRSKMNKNKSKSSQKVQKTPRMSVSSKVGEIFKCTYPGCDKTYTVASSVTRHVKNNH